MCKIMNDQKYEAETGLVVLAEINGVVKKSK